MDVVEIPSHLMEYFSRDARSLRLIARHHSSGDPIPDALLANLSKSINCCSSFDRQEQVRSALSNLALAHLPRPANITLAVVLLYPPHCPYLPSSLSFRCSLRL